MKHILTVVLITLCCWATGISYAYRNPTFKAQQQEKIFKIELTAAQVNSVVNGLKKLPYEESAELINNIVSQAQRQVKPDVPAVQDTLKKKK